MSEQTLNTIAFMTMVISLFSRKYRVAEAVAYHYLRKFGATALMIEHYDYLHTQDYEQVVDDLADYCRRHGGTLK